MAVFNPQVQPTQDPNYLNYSRVIDPPPVNTATGQLLKGAGEMLTGAVNAVDTAIKTGIDNRVYEGVDKERDTMTEGLELIKRQTRSMVPAPAQGVAGGKVAEGKSLLDANAMMDEDAAVPEGLEQGLDRVNLLSAARASAKINDTQYSGQVLSLAKQLRQEYGPGYRDYIDQRISQASGLPVANAYYQNLITDINRQLGAQKSADKSMDSLVLKNLDVPGITGFYKQFKAGQMPEDVLLTKIADHQQMMTKLRIDAAKRAEKTDNRTVVIADTQKTFDGFAADYVTRTLSDVVDLGGQKTKVEDLVKSFTETGKGNLEQNDMQVQQRQTQLNAVISDVKMQMHAKAREGGENSILAYIGPKAVEDSINKALFPLQTTADFAGRKEDGLAYVNARQAEAIKADATRNILLHKDVGAASRQLYGVRSVVGDAAFPVLMPNIISSDVDVNFRGLTSQESLSAIQPIVDEKGKLIQRSMKQAIDHAKDVGATSESGVYKFYVEKIPSWITNPNLNNATKDRVIDWAFDPKKNKGAISDLKPDYVDPRTNTVVEGRDTAFKNLTSKNMVDSIVETAKVKPENYGKYMKTVEGEFSTILRSDIQGINNVVLKVPSIEFTYDTEGRIGLADKKTGRPVLRNEKYMGANNPQGVYLNGVLDQIERVNGGLQNLAYAQSKDPSGARDTSLYVFNVLSENRANEDILRAVVKARNPDIAISPAKINKTEQMPPAAIPFSNTPNLGPSVTQFTRNPTGELPRASERPSRGSRGVIKGNLSDSEIVGIKTEEIPADVDPAVYYRRR